MNYSIILENNKKPNPNFIPPATKIKSMNWIEKMKVGMKFIGEACGESMELGGCDNCPFEKFCNLINEYYWKNDMKETMEQALKEAGYE